MAQEAGDMENYSKSSKNSVLWNVMATLFVTILISSVSSVIATRVSIAVVDEKISNIQNNVARLDAEYTEQRKRLEDTVTERNQKIAALTEKYDKMRGYLIKIGSKTGVDVEP